ncbi:MAG: hypothetical protein AB7K52_12135 [Phycisphaerales bacterium]
MRSLCAAAMLGAIGCEEKKPAPAPSSGAVPAPAAEPVQNAAANSAAAAQAQLSSVPQAAREALNDYLKELGTLNSAIEKIKAPSDIAGALPLINKSSSEIRSFVTVLNGLSAEQKTMLADSARGPLESAHGALAGQVSRLSGNPLTSQVAEVLRGIKLFQP